MDSITIKIDREAVEAIASLLSALFKREESTKEERNTTNTDIDTNNDIVSPKDTNTNKATILRSKDTNIDISISNNSNNNKNNNNTVIDAAEDSSGISINTNAYSEYHGNSSDTGAEIPTLEDVIAYVKERNYSMSPKKFFDYYKNKGWKTKNGVSIAGVWKGYVDTWAKSEYSNQNNVSTTPKTGMGTVEERRAAHPFVPTKFD